MNLTTIGIGGLSRLLGPCNSCCSSIDASMAFVRTSSMSGVLVSGGSNWVSASTANEG